MDWKEIEDITGAYQNQFEGELTSGERPLPIGLAIRESESLCFEVMRGVFERHIQSAEDVQELANQVRLRTRDCAASGMLALLPRSLACRMLGIEDEPAASENVGVLHVEHVTDGVKTWMLDVPNLIPVGKWSLIHAGSRSGLPTFFHVLRYNLGGAAKC